MKKMLITTTPILEGYEVKSYLGVVNVNVVIGTNFFSDFAASFTDVFGGNSGTYQRKMDLMYEEAKEGLEKKVKKLGGNAILGFKIDFDEISGKGKSMFMLSASGTACLVDSPKIDEKTVKVEPNKVSSEYISQELQKRNIIAKIINNPREVSDNEWSFMVDHSSADIVELILQKVYYFLNGDEREKIHQMVSLLEYEDACRIVYSTYEKPCIIEALDSYGSVVKDDSSDLCAVIIKACHLFNAARTKELIDSDFKKAIKIIDSEKDYYDSEDLKNMQEICLKFDNLPDVGKIEVGKDGLFSKEKELFICRNGHKNDSSFEYCTECYENIKGLTKEVNRKIQEFKMRTDILSQLINNDA